MSSGSIGTSLTTVLGTFSPDDQLKFVNDLEISGDEVCRAEQRMPLKSVITQVANANLSSEPKSNLLKAIAAKISTIVADPAKRKESQLKKPLFPFFSSRWVRTVEVPSETSKVLIAARKGISQIRDKQKREEFIESIVTDDTIKALVYGEMETTKVKSLHQLLDACDYSASILLKVFAFTARDKRESLSKELNKYLSIFSRGRKSRLKNAKDPQRGLEERYAIAIKNEPAFTELYSDTANYKPDVSDLKQRNDLFTEMALQYYRSYVHSKDASILDKLRSLNTNDNLQRENIQLALEKCAECVDQSSFPDSWGADLFDTICKGLMAIPPQLLKDCGILDSIATKIVNTNNWRKFELEHWIAFEKLFGTLLKQLPESEDALLKELKQFHRLVFCMKFIRDPEIIKSENTNPNEFIRKLLLLFDGSQQAAIYRELVFSKPHHNLLAKIRDKIPSIKDMEKSISLS